MNEPKKRLIIAAAKVRWPKAVGFFLNHRKHTIRVMFGGLEQKLDFTVGARSHAALLTKIKESEDE